MNNDFSNVKVGDKLWSVICGWGMVKEKNTEFIRLKSSSDQDWLFNKNGNLYDYPKHPQSLFFEEMEMVPVSKPEEAKVFDPNKPYQRRDGKEAKIVHITKNGDFIVITPVTDSVYSCNQNGRYLTNEHNADLINIPEKIEGWINVYPDMVHETKEVADNHNYKRGTPIRVACIQVSFPKGEGL